jgi:hypothetical protein
MARSRTPLRPLVTPCRLSLRGQVQQRDYFITQSLNLIIIWSKLKGPPRLEISFSIYLSGLVWIRSWFQSLLGKQPAKMRSQTSIRRIHLHCGSQPLGCSLGYPVLYPFLNCQLG